MEAIYYAGTKVRAEASCFASLDAPGIQESVAVLRNGLEAMQSASCVALITTTAMAPVL
jgi:hypothetical protein